MSDQLFPDLEGDFEVVDAIEGQLDAGSIHAAIAEQQLRRTHWRLSFQRVQFGVYQNTPVCLLVIDGKFHAEDHKRHRFTWLRISVEFAGSGEPVEILTHCPERAYGISVPEHRASSWTLSSKISIALPGIPVTVDLFDFQKNASRKHQIDRLANMQASERGFPVVKEVVWTLEEAIQEGVPWRIPSLVVMLKSPAGEPFSAKFRVQTKVNFSLNPLRSPLLAAARQVHFDGVSELVAPGKELDRDFTSLDLSTLSKLNFADDR